MKVKFLRKYGKNKIGDEIILTIDEKEKKYLISNGTIIILEDDTAEDEIPTVKIDDEKAGKNGRKKNSE